ncbi:hypothetical protein PGUG_00864 [Meyerozyma guilliermondii ATCC 6260]|uniref:Chloride channel protein n=1 Tax=Meyerozyma guilliermondii (strain ATCC 6260 / CBS 566 / DSM 6381 / JCM 1539 / NBRC 10279 / NRRL Y-324) TaxID=294746 RepID=A5DC59_PICGU|nr:uncharacterized protein PGUG_00864 [Meyerozyma guilliermondii ATCC 6260]EDK36766.2 hypothetical protein PGUG_00864 [Meyerozyma guilliermondii ATCC 6260]
MLFHFLVAAKTSRTNFGPSRIATDQLSVVSFSSTMVDTNGSQTSYRDPSGSWKFQDKVKEVQRFDDFVTIDWVEDELDEHLQRLAKKKTSHSQTSLFQRIMAFSQTWFVLALMGLMIGCIAGCLNIITAWLGSLRSGHCGHNFYLSKAFCCWGSEEETCDAWQEYTPFGLLNYLLYIFISIGLAMGSAQLVKLYSPSAAGSGISEIKCIVSGFVVKGFLGWWTLLIKSLGLPLAIASGLSLGKEGPSVHYAVCVGNSVARSIQKYRRSASKGRDFLTATAAAGVAVAFGSPMGGVLFSIEEISSVFQLSTIWKSYFCSLVAVTTLAALNPFRTGQLVLFEVTYDNNWHAYDIPFYILLGIFGGVYGIVVSKLNIRVVSFRKKYLKNHALREVLILATLSASFCYFNEFLRLDMTEAMQSLFHDCSNSQHFLCEPDSNKTVVFSSLIFATIARMFLTIITYGCKVPAGIFVPSMAAGATFGRAIGTLVEAFYNSHKSSPIFATCLDKETCVIPGTYAFLGAGAALSGITHLTVTVVIIMFELTGAVRYIIPTMIVVAITKIINDKWGHGGIADQMIRFNGLPFIDTKEEFDISATAADAMSQTVVTIPTTAPESITVGNLKTILRETSYRGYPLINSSLGPTIVGYVTRTDLEQILETSDHLDESSRCNFLDGSDGLNLSRIVYSSPITVSQETNLEYLVNIFTKLGPRNILVQNDNYLVGIISRKDILRFEFTHHHVNGGLDYDEQAQDAFDAKVWNKMNEIIDKVQRKLGVALHNDETRYTRI